MLKITYDPMAGKVVPDGFVKNWADGVVKAYEEVIDMDITIGSSVMIDATRVLIIEGRLDHKEVIYRFKGLDPGVDKNGRLPVWPGGFCDIYDDILEELLNIDDGIIKE